MAAPRLHANVLIDEMMRIFEADLKTPLDLKAVVRGALEFLPIPEADPEAIIGGMVNGIWLHLDPTTTIEPVAFPTDLRVIYRHRIVYVRRINVSENVLYRRVEDVQTIVDKIMDTFQLPSLTLNNGQVLWWMPTEVEWEPPEDAYVAAIAADLVAVAVRTECVVRTRR